jgi:hypothetical protein
MMQTRETGLIGPGTCRPRAHAGSGAARSERDSAFRCT